MAAKQTARSPKTVSSGHSGSWPISRILSMLLGWKILLLVFAYLGSKLVQLEPTFLPLTELRNGVPFDQWVWANMDGDHYTRIARWGYAGGQHIFFPLLPLSIRFTQWLTGLPYITSGLFVSHLFFLTALWFIYRLLRTEGKQALFPLLLLVMLCYPTSVFYTAVYTDSIFLLMATMTIYFGRTRRFWLAGATGFLAGLTRLNGLALIGYLGLEYVWGDIDVYKTSFRELWRQLLSRLSPVRLFRHGAVAIIGPLFGLLAYLWHTQAVYGNWYLVFSDASIWGRQQMVLPLQTFWRYAKILVLSDRTTFIYWVAVYELAATLLYCFILVWSWRKIRFAYWCFFLFYLLIPMSTGTLQGMNRYGLHLFPFFLGLTLLFTKHPRWFWVYALAGITLLAATVIAYTRGYFIA